MRIIVAESAGFCWGVRRAMDRTLSLTETEPDAPKFTLGPLIHNRQVVEFLDQRGIHVTDDPSRLTGGTVVIRAHGTTPEMLKKLKEWDVNVCNATCPRVGRVQAIIRKSVARGASVVIAGDPDHAEVKSFLAYAGNRGFRVSDPADIAQLPHLSDVVLVSQTTFNSDTFGKIASVLEAHCDHLDIHDTICDSTARRQDEVRALAKQADCMVIIGGRHSANTSRLAEVASGDCDRVYHVESEKELEDIDLDNVRILGVSAGASTPNWLINSVVHYLRFKRTEGSPLRRMIAWVSHAYVFRSIAAMFLSGGIQLLFVSGMSWKALVIAGLYMLAISNLNRLVEPESLLYLNPARYHFVRANRIALLSVSLLSLGALVVLAWHISMQALLVAIVASLLGIGYRVRIPIRSRKVRIFDIPGSKNLLHASAWSLVIAILPLMESRIELPALAGGALSVFVIVFGASILFDIRDIQGDRFYGKETLPILIGTRATAILTGILSVLMVVFVICCGATSGGFPVILNATLIGIYLLVLFKLVTKHRFIGSGGWFEIAVGCLALIPLLTALLR